LGEGRSPAKGHGCRSSHPSVLARYPALLRRERATAILHVLIAISASQRGIVDYCTGCIEILMGAFQWRSRQ
jgi:hypothetical protein